MDLPDGTSHEIIHRIFYLEVLAFTRLILLVPQFLKSISGERLTYPTTMKFIIMGTLLLSFGHVVALLAIDGTDELRHMKLETDDIDNDLGVVWLAVLLTALSCVFHRACLRVLRTTAPPVHGRYLSKTGGNKHASKRLAYHYRKILYETGSSNLSREPSSRSLNPLSNATTSGVEHGADEAAGAFYSYQQQLNLQHQEDSTLVEPLLEATLANSTPTDGSLLGEVSSNEGDFRLDILSTSAENMSILDRLKLRLKIMQQSNGCQPNMNQFSCLPEDNDSKNEFLSELITRVEEAKKNWGRKLNKVTERLRIPVSVPIATHYGPPGSVFRLILDLFIYDGDPLPMLEKHWEEPGDFQGQQDQIFFIPQICTFLIYGAFLNSHELEAFLLDKCRRNLRFAHGVYWFLLAWSLELNHMKFISYGQPGIKNKGLTRSHGSDSNILNSPSRKKGHRRSHSNGYENNSKFLPEDYRMIASLVNRVQKCGEEAAKNLLKKQTQFAFHYEISPVMKQNAGNYVPSCGGLPSPSHYQTVMSDVVVGVWDNERVESCVNADEFSIAFHFNATPAFFHELTRIADDLFFVDSENRSDALRGELELLDTRFLPSNLIYVPFDKQEHVVWRIVKEESFALSTKERVPCFVTLECVNLVANDEIDDELLAWYKTPRHPQRHNTIFQKLQERAKASLKGVIKLRRSNSDNDLLSRHDVDDDDEYSYLSGDVESSDVSGVESDYTSKADLGQWATTGQHSPQSLSLRNIRRRNTELQRNSPSYGTNDQFNLITTSPYNSSNKPPRAPSKVKRSQKQVVVFKEDWAQKSDRIREKSCFGKHPGWTLLPVFVKSNDDLRQEQLASQLIHRMAVILSKAKIPVWLYPYQIVALSNTGGIIEAVPDTISISSLKRNYPNWVDLPTFFEEHYSEDADHLAGAKANFVESIAAYSIVCYLLQVKDRHNGNILITKNGHIVHIDFGFFFLSSPGKNTGFESAPFKLTSDYVNVMGGTRSKAFTRFRSLCVKTFMELRKNCHQITLLVDMLSAGNEDLPCFRQRPDLAIDQLRERFKLEMNDAACESYVNDLINESIENWRTTCYDRYQYCCVGVL